MTLRNDLSCISCFLKLINCLILLAPVLFSLILFLPLCEYCSVQEKFLVKYAIKGKQFIKNIVLNGNKAPRYFPGYLFSLSNENQVS